ncbi:TonB-dependent receptor [Asticcacaulis sp. ZE23SCel15]|uniref:TonB-dependent receptor n=1 Tax=Asticcacaulis sp. ZE23SCel15 TaxID=3059027 RepID=UPI00265F9A54|nr:TonB-dependent receptor [Asticcacaulis sp. ZE23SCel15]WKL57946.1 TonB-dependent receptor [Asticcacaulis sp. ZE23SCel15]
MKLKSLYVDAKITHKFSPNAEVFLEARNITKEARITNNGDRFGFADGTPYVNGLYYGGRTFSVGVTYRN